MEIPEEILLKLKCDDCDDYLSSSPVYLREDGNRICGSCEASCSTPADKIRITLYEDLAQLMLFPCKNKKYGCHQNLPFNDESDHETVCEFREATCPFLEYGNCDWVGGNKDIFNHCRLEHKGKVLSNATEYEVEGFAFLLINAFDKLFTLRIKIGESSGNIFHSINYMDESEDASNYNYDLVVLNKSFKHIKISHEMKKAVLRKSITSFELEINLHNTTTNKTVSILLFNDDSAENRWSKQLEENKMMCSNCNFIDIKTKVDKHVWHFCKDGRSCEICTKDITESTIDEHRSSAHSDIILENGTSWRTLLSKERKWRIISSDVGDLLCSYEISLSGLEVRVISPLTRRQLGKFTCVFEICGLDIKKELDVQKDDHIDWHTQIDIDEISSELGKEFSFKFEIFKNK